MDNSDESLCDTAPASFAVSAFSLNRLRDPASTSTTSLPSKHMELLLRMARLGRTHSVTKLLLMYIEHPHIIGYKKLSIDSLIVVCYIPFLFSPLILSYSFICESLFRW